MAQFVLEFGADIGDQPELPLPRLWFGWVVQEDYPARGDFIFATGSVGDGIGIDIAVECEGPGG